MVKNPVEKPVIDGPQKVLRDAKGRIVKGARLNPKGHKGPRQWNTQAITEAIYKVKGEKAFEFITRQAFHLLKKGNTTLLCKILDKIVPSKIENKGEMTVTHREEFLRMRARAMSILEQYGANKN